MHSSIQLRTAFSNSARLGLLIELVIISIFRKHKRPPTRDAEITRLEAPNKLSREAEPGSMAERVGREKSIATPKGVMACNPGTGSKNSLPHSIARTFRVRWACFADAIYQDVTYGTYSGQGELKKMLERMSLEADACWKADTWVRASVFCPLRAIAYHPRHRNDRLWRKADVPRNAPRPTISAPGLPAARCAARRSIAVHIRCPAVTAWRAGAFSC